jgi:biopolymer transport protein ExbB/TolQ
MLMQLNLIEIASYGFMLYLLAKAVAHWSEGFSMRRRARATAMRLTDIEIEIFQRGPTPASFSKLRELAPGTNLGSVLESDVTPENLPALMEIADEAIRADIEKLDDACQQNEISGPRWGLLFTVLGAAFALSGIGNNTSAESQIGNIAFALKNTGLGLLVAIIEASTIARQVFPAADTFRDVSRRALRLLAEDVATDQHDRAMIAAGRRHQAPTVTGRRDQEEMANAT